MKMGQFDERCAHKSRDHFDLKLVSRVQKGDRDAFDLLLVKYQNRLAVIVSRYLEDEADIAEVTYEIFLRAYRSINAFRAETTFHIWLLKLAIQHLKSYLQKHKATKTYSTPIASGRSKVAISKLSQLDSGSMSKPCQLSAGIENALKVMPAELSVALLLKEFDELSYLEISDVMICPVATVRSRIFRARELLENTLKSLSEHDESSI